VSSIHVNGWFGDYDKLTMTRRLFRDCWQLDLDSIRDECVFVGDSPNDQPMFAFFPQSVGVANVAAFAAQMSALPAYITEQEGGHGFAELTELLLG
jgi:hydroxymethylpyrimidine pyrophosphatase-like HAD family hydrolase